MSATRIEWATDAWNPITGCSKCSPGCDNCYAERMAKRLGGRFEYPTNDPFKPATRHMEKYEEPLRWRTPRKVFVSSMGDLFHETVEDWMLDEIFAVMLACRFFSNRPDHVFQLLTKRPERMQAYLSAPPMELLKRWSKAGNGWIIMEDEDTLLEEAIEASCSMQWDEEGYGIKGSEKKWGHPNGLFPLPNVRAGVTICNQEEADRKISLLLQVPAAKRFISVEPMLGPVNLEMIPCEWSGHSAGGCLNALSGEWWPAVGDPEREHAERMTELPRLDWVICGGESGPKARPMHPDWVRSLRDQCASAGVPFLFKQWGEWAPRHDLECNQLQGKLWHNFDPDTSVCRVGKKVAGRLIDGVEHNEFPEAR